MQRETREVLTFCATVLAVGLAVVWYAATGLATLSGSPTVAGRYEAWGLPGWVRGRWERSKSLAHGPPHAQSKLLRRARADRHGGVPDRDDRESRPAPWFELAGPDAGLLVYLFRPGRMNRLLAEDPDQLS